KVSKGAGVPDGNVGVIVVSGITAPIPDVENAPIAKSDLGSEPGRAQGQSNVVPRAKVFLDQRRERQVGKDVAAVNQEALLGQQRFRILDPATGIQQNRLVN